MSTKFVSKSSNLMVVLRPGVEGNRAIGTHMKPGLYARFQGGLIDVKDETMIQLLKEHPGFGTDFIEVAENAIDPFEYNRDEIEPVHVLHEMKYGHVERVKGQPAPKVKLSPEIKNLIQNEAIKMLPELLKTNPGILKDILTNLVAEKEAKETPVEDVEVPEETEKITVTPAKRGPGRPVVKK